jgi:hypothetical protein
MKPQNHRSYGNVPQAPAPLLPVSIVALGAPAGPVERLMGLQSAFSRLVVLLTSFRLPRPIRSPRPSIGHRAFEI